MANASRAPSRRIPDNLYGLCINNIVRYIHRIQSIKDGLRVLPDMLLMDVYFKLYEEKKLCYLSSELSDLEVFERLLRFSGAQLRLLQCFQAVVEHGSRLSTELVNAYMNRCNSGAYTPDQMINLALRFGGFLNEAGLYADAQTVLIKCRDMCLARPRTTYYKRLTLECCHRLLNTQSSYCCFPAAADTYSLALELLGITEKDIDSLTDAHLSEMAASLGGERPSWADMSAKISARSYAVGDTRSVGVQTDGEGGDSYTSSGRSSLHLEEACPMACGHEAASGAAALLPRLLKEFSALAFVRCDYGAAYAWSARALSLLTPRTPHRVTVEVLRACATACVVKRRFGSAATAVRSAVALARACCGPRHPRLAAALLDYGFYLLNIDMIHQSVGVYEEAIAILRATFGRTSLHVATAQEDLAYALYVLEYSSGRFYKAREHAERAIRIIEDLVPADHLLLASAKRVKALILEEIALDTPPGQDAKGSLLEQAEALHRAALRLSTQAFGERNVQTAKHYGNLGRLYQSMHKFRDAEAMHLKAIAIKEELLGPEDFEVGLSIGHLASLYNYHMSMFPAAEQLYLRSIAISLKLFGERYSGLEYDYRGLVHVFTQLKRHEDADAYNAQLQRWHELREQYQAEHQPAVGDEQLLPIDELRDRFFSPND